MAEAPVPPPQHFRHMGHHWLASPQLSVSQIMVAQWNPGSKTWTHSNEHDTYGSKPLNLEGWVWLAHIPVPEHWS